MIIVAFIFHMDLLLYVAVGDDSYTERYMLRQSNVGCVHILHCTAVRPVQMWLFLGEH